MLIPKGKKSSSEVSTLLSKEPAKLFQLVPWPTSHDLQNCIRA